MQRLLAWLDGQRREAAVKVALGKVDTDSDVTLATSGGGDGKHLWQVEFSKGHFGPLARRDERRQQGMTRAPMSSVAAPVRCWQCVQMGHTAKDCQQGSVTRLSGGQESKVTLLASLDKRIAEKERQTKHPVLSLKHQILCRKLAQVNLEAKIDINAQGTPKNIRGIGGGAAVCSIIVCTARIPTSLKDIPGQISFIVITGSGGVPALLPLPLMKALGADIHASLLQELPTGHLGCSILEGIEKWQCLHPHEEEFRLKEGSGEKLKHVRQRSKELLLIKNVKCAAHYVFDGIRMPSSSQAVCPQVRAKSKMGLLSQAVLKELCPRREETAHVIIADRNSPYSELAGNNDGNEGPCSTKRGNPIIKQHYHGSYESSSVCKEPFEQAKGVMSYVPVEGCVHPVET
eukprot:5111116-Amphidinium_carterae.4